MELYKEITLLELFGLIKKGETNDLYFKQHGNIIHTRDYNFSLEKIHKTKFFKKEIQGEKTINHIEETIE